jgi:hypothetical protein
LDNALYFFNALFCFGEFNSSCGLRQGDPLSSLVFVIVKDALSKMLSAAVYGILLSGFFVGSKNVGALHISHLLFSFDFFLFFIFEKNIIKKCKAQSSIQETYLLKRKKKKKKNQENHES